MTLFTFFLIVIYLSFSLCEEETVCVDGECDVVEGIGEKAFNASVKGDINLLKRLLEQSGASINVKNKNGATPLFGAALSGNKDMLKYVIDAGADVNIRQVDGATALLSCAFTEFWEGVTMLLRAGADVKAVNEKGAAPIHGASLSGGVMTVIELVEAGADVAVQDDSGIAPLHLAALMRNVPAIGILAERGADVNVRDVQGRSPLHYLCSSASVPDPDNDRPSEVVLTAKILIESGAVVDAVDEQGRTPLHWCAQRGHNNTIELLLESGANINARDRLGYSPLFSAFPSQQSWAVKVLLEYDADTNVANEKGETVLHWAAKKNFPQLTARLMEHGAVPLVRDLRDALALHYAAANGAYEVVHLLLKTEAGAFMDARDNNSRTPLFLAASKGNAQAAKAIRFLLLKGASADSRAVLHVSHVGWTPVHAAAASGHIEALKELLSASDASVNAPAKVDSDAVLPPGHTETLDTPLHVAVRYGSNVEAITILHEAGASLTAKNSAGDTPLQLAERLLRADETNEKIRAMVDALRALQS